MKGQITYVSRWHYRIILYLLAVINFNTPAYSKEGRNAAIKGDVMDADQNKLEFATVYLKNTSWGTTTNQDGDFLLNVLPGRYTLCVQLLGHSTHEEEIELNTDERKYLHIVLKTDKIELNNVEVIGKSVVEQINKTAYNVVAIDAKTLYNSTLDVAHTLDRVSGVKLKEVGGLGSETQVSLNGFSGRHVRVFMDGIPMDGAGSSMQMSKIPVNFADRIEVYKGVVPIELGSDALGGAINIVTKKTKRNFVDASYTYGSFNTYKSSLSLGYHSPKGINLQLTAFQNYSDNNYRVKTKYLSFVNDPANGLYLNKYSDANYWFKRFHDTYHNEAVIARMGVSDKWWATRLMFETTVSQEHADIQNSNIMQIAFGGKAKESKSVIPALYYEKRDLFTPNLNASITAKYNLVRSNNIDTLARQYNWSGEYRIKTAIGESQYSLSEFDSYSGYYGGNLNYRLAERHLFSINNIYSSFTRKATDAAANSENSTEATFMRRMSRKNITGFSYRVGDEEQWNVSVFAKSYVVNVTGPVDISTTSAANYVEQDKNFNALGYGFAASNQLMNGLLLKGSYELSYRLPTENELFGDEVLENGDASLKAELSDNINLNIGLNRTSGNHSWNIEAGMIYRLTRDYIRRLIEAKYGGAYFTNHGKVITMGMDLDARYFYGRKFSVGGNITYQDIRNMEQYSPTGQTLIYYKDRMPNVPFLFANSDANYQWNNLIWKKTQLILGYNLQYVYEFYRNWVSEGGDIYIPTQLSHDLSLTYSINDGRYNIALEAKNITNELMYDNYSLQKPGRSFYVKIRYAFHK